MKRTFFKTYIVLSSLFLLFALTSCTVSYKLNGASIDYSKIRTISIADFPNMAPYVYPTLANQFSESLRDKYSRQTRLQLLRTGGDLDLQGEIVGYDFTSISIDTEGYASEMRLTLTINVRFTNKKNPEEDFEKRYSAYQTTKDQIESVQDQLLVYMINDITDEIYNDTVAKW